MVEVVRNQEVVSHHQSLYLHLSPAGFLATPREPRVFNCWKRLLVLFHPNGDHAKTDQELLEKLEHMFGLKPFQPVQHRDSHFRVDFGVHQLGDHVVLKLLLLDK